MASDKTALAGLHGDGLVIKTICRTLRGYGFEVETAANLGEMLEYCRQKRYDAYVMDLNFGVVGGADITPARDVYAVLREQKIERLEEKFIGLSGRLDIVDVAVSEGIPAVCKPFFCDRFRELFGAK